MNKKPVKSRRTPTAPALFDKSGASARKIDTKFKQKRHNFYGRQLVLQGYERHALEHLVKVMGVKPEDIVVECENDFAKTLNIRYKYRGEMHVYVPDAYVKSQRTVIECKSLHTLGIKSKIARGWAMNCAKAKAAKAKGYSIILLLMQDDGSRIPMPRGWYDMTKAEVIEALRPYLSKHEEFALL